jgi:hypothetical protein
MQPEAVDKGMAFPSRAGASDAGRGLTLCYNETFVRLLGQGVIRCHAFLIPRSTAPESTNNPIGVVRQNERKRCQRRIV